MPSGSITFGVCQYILYKQRLNSFVLVAFETYAIRGIYQRHSPNCACDSIQVFSAYGITDINIYTIYRGSERGKDDQACLYNDNILTLAH